MRYLLVIVRNLQACLHFTKKVCKIQSGKDIYSLLDEERCYLNTHIANSRNRSNPLVCLALRISANFTSRNNNYFPLIAKMDRSITIARDVMRIRKQHSSKAY